MKILICTKYDIIANMMLNIIIPKIGSNHEIKVILANRNRQSLDEIMDVKWLTFFTEEFPSQCLFPLIDSMMNNAEMPLNAKWLSFSQMAKGFDVDIETVGHIADSETLTNMVKKAEPDLLISFQFGFIFKSAALAYLKLGGMNLHTGLLPERAGLNPTFWCMKEGNKETGCTLHWLSPKLDAGGIIEKRSILINYNRSFLNNLIENYRSGAAMICDAINFMSRGGSLTSSAQDLSKIQYVPKITRKDCQDFLSTGHRLVDPQDISELIGYYLPVPKLN